MLPERPPRVWLAWNVASLAVLLAAAWASAGLPTSPPPATPVALAPTPTPLPSVAVLSVDGLRADALVQAELPSLRGLMARGAYTLSARSVVPSETLPGHASMLSGMDPGDHQITSDWDG
jgi:predicted AlkP superfamily pyrophosphatase or phosphodiesterase